MSYMLLRSSYYQSSHRQICWFGHYYTWSFLHYLADPKHVYDPTNATLYGELCPNISFRQNQQSPARKLET